MKDAGRKILRERMVESNLAANKEMRQTGTSIHHN
jgi:hypothetical protein